MKDEQRIAQERRIGNQRRANRELVRENARLRKALEEIERKASHTGNELEIPYVLPIAELARKALGKAG